MPCKLVLIGCVAILFVSCQSSGALKQSSPQKRGEFMLEVTPTVTGSRNAVLRAGDEVPSGDGIQVVIKSMVDAHVYVGYCDRNHQLTIFPRDGGIEVAAGTIIYAPAQDAHIILDDQVGPEVLYVIASRRPLDVADPELASAISRARSNSLAECGESLDEALKKGQQILSEGGLAEQRELHAESPSAPSAAPPSIPNPDARLRDGPQHSHSQSRVPRPVSLERGGFIRWDAMGTVSAGGDHHDIVILRYGYTHVAARSP